MTVTANNNEFALRKAIFVWGFDTGASHTIRPLFFPANNPLASKSAELLREIARCGWDVPGVDVHIAKAESRSGKLFSFVSSIVLDNEKSHFKLAFDMSINAASDGSSTNFIDYFHEVGSENTHYADKVAANDPAMKTFHEIVDRHMARLKSYPTADGHNAYTPEGDANLIKLLAEPVLPAPQISPVLYTRVAPHLLEASREDGSARLFGPRLLPLSSGLNRDQLHPRAFDSFAYASTNPDLRVGNGNFLPSGDDLIVEVKPQALNEIYVVDGARRLETEMAYQELTSRSGRDYLHPDEAEDIVTAVAKTMTPITEYKGGFEAPVYLIGRCLLPGEARLVRGPTEVVKNDEVISVKLIDALRGRKITIEDIAISKSGALEHAVQLAERVAGQLKSEALIPLSVTQEINNARRDRYKLYVERQLKSGERDALMDMLMKPALR